MAETPSPLSDPRYRAGVRLRRGGRFEAAANLLAEVLTLATEGAPDERQLDPTLAPLYYEYGVALVGVAREAAAAEEDAEAAPSPKRRRPPWRRRQPPQTQQAPRPAQAGWGERKRSKAL